MHAAHLTSIAVASATWVGFGSAMKTYFRHANQRNTAKSFLIVGAFVCTIAQIVTLSVAKPPGMVWFWLGSSAYALANGLFWSALCAHGKASPAFAFIPVPPSTLTTAGPYRLVRHPIYAAYLLAWCAGAVIAAQPWMLLAVGCMGLFYVRAAREEEKAFLASPMAGPYLEYQRQTGMFIPKLTRLLSSRPLSW